MAASTDQLSAEERPRSKGPRRWWATFIRIMGRVQQALFTLRLGWLVGHSMAIVVHQGRRSGKTYSTAVFVKRYERATCETSIVSVFGETDWYWNLRAGGIVRLQIGRDRYRPSIRLLDTDEIAALEMAFRRRHPIVARTQAWLMRWPWDTNEDEFMAWASGLRGVALRPST